LHTAKGVVLWLAFACVVLSLTSERAVAQESALRITLKDQLEKGLQARRPQEFAFIAHVVSRVEEGSLPRSLVDSTFLWARSKRPYPFPYFERGLKVRAKKAGINI